MRPLIFGSVIPLVVMAGQAAADVPLKGLFVARKACPAVQSIRTGANPGGISIRPSQTYRLIAKNRPDASHFLIDVEGASPSRRWVAVECGEQQAGSPAGGGGSQGEAANPTPPPASGSYVLAISWQPAFCEGKPEKTECKTQTESRFDASYFSLHGLWPQPSSRAYCGVARSDIAADESGNWDALSPVALEASTRNALDRIMPGTMSKLDRHEWVKHGTCVDGVSAQRYFATAIALVDEVNQSKLQALFASRVGQEVSSDEIREAMDASFGHGAGQRVRVSCKRDSSRNLITELTIGLEGGIGEKPPIAELIAAAKPTKPGCPAGVVDQVGRQ
jgi:ribonuclease T2